MEFSPNEQRLFEDLQRTDFNNLSKNDFLSFTSRLGEINPEVAKELISQFPQLFAFFTSIVHDNMEIIHNISENEEKRFEKYHETIDQELKNASESRKLFYGFAMQVHLDFIKCLENPNLSHIERMEILDRSLELLRIVKEKDSEIRDYEREMEDKENKKDTEKKESAWRISAGIAGIIILTVGIGAAIYGGKIDFNPPTES